MPIWSAEIKELERLHESFKGQFPLLEKELEQLLKFDDPNVILLYSRRCLEVILTDLCECELKRSRGTEPLKGIIDKLHKERKLPDHIATSMHGLNDLSTYGTHPKDFDPEQIKPVLNNLDIILKWYLKYKGFSVVVKAEQGVQTIDIKPKVAKVVPIVRRTLILRKYIPAAIILLGALLFLQDRNSRKKWAKEKALTEIEQLVNEENIAGAFSLVQKAKKFISKDPEFEELSSLVTSDLTILTDPPGSKVYIREYTELDEKWRKLGQTPINNAKIPGGSSFWGANSYYLARLEKSGHESILAMISTNPGLNSTNDTLYRKLFIKGTIPEGMVYVEGLGEEVKGNFDKEKHGFFIDRCEVTNKQYKEFVDKGGYRPKDYWKNEFIKDGKILAWDEAMTYFADKTGRPGPSTWVAGDYPEGQDDYPVSGISWYEADAYADYSGKSLPTAEHWFSGAGGDFFNQTFYSKLIAKSNFNNNGTEAVGKYQGITRFGAYDMAGNVREWCWNETPLGHIIRGGAWNDQSYLFDYLSQIPSFDRSDKNGFRCVQYIDKEKISKSTFQPIKYSEKIDYLKVIPVDDKIFEVFKSLFFYDKTALDSKIEETDIINKDWSVEKVIFNSAYGKEKVVAYLYLPKSGYPPYQTLILFPGAYAFNEHDMTKYTETTWLIDYLLKNGRAVMCPVYKGMFERIDDQEPVVLSGHQLTDWIIRWTKDFSRSIDYLETRTDIDINRLGYYGSSLGGAIGGIIPAVEGRLKVNILIVGGLSGDGTHVSYVSRIKIPTLMLNGKYDYTFPYEKSVLPFYNFLGTPAQDKKLIPYDTDHYVPKNEMIKEVLAWCDKYFGPVNYKNQ
jgi:dienelactone hydrolase